MSSIPQDPFILFSWTNTQLRDNFPSLDALCEEMNIEKEDLVRRLGALGYEYNESLNKFW